MDHVRYSVYKLGTYTCVYFFSRTLQCFNYQDIREYLVETYASCSKLASRIWTRRFFYYPLFHRIASDREVHAIPSDLFYCLFEKMFRFNPNWIAPLWFCMKGLLKYDYKTHPGGYSCSSDNIQGCMSRFRINLYIFVIRKALKGCALDRCFYFNAYNFKFLTVNSNRGRNFSLGAHKYKIFSRTVILLLVFNFNNGTGMSSKIVNFLYCVLEVRYSNNNNNFISNSLFT